MKKINIIILAVSALAFFGAGLFLIRPMMAEIDDYSSKTEASDIAITSFNVIKKTLIGQKKIQETADFGKIQETIPIGDPGIPDLLVQIQALSSKSGVAIKDFSFAVSDGTNTSLLSASDAALSGEIANGSFSTIGISINITGIYSSIKSFIKAVENNVRIMDIVELGIRGSETSDSLEMSADMKINAYYKLSEEENVN